MWLCVHGICMCGICPVFLNVVCGMFVRSVYVGLYVCMWYVCWYMWSVCHVVCMVCVLRVGDVCAWCWWGAGGVGCV